MSRLKESLRQGKLTRVFGAGQLCHPKVIEIVGQHGGYDAVWLDQEHEEADRQAGRRVECPTLVLTGAAETQLSDAGDVWREWAGDLCADTVPGGHFIPEEAPEALAAALEEFLTT